MILGRAFGWAFLILALVVLARDVWTWIGGGPIRLMRLGELWFHLDSESLNLTQALTQRYLHPAVWDPGVVTVLLWPAAMILAGVGLVLLVAFRRRRGRSG